MALVMFVAVVLSLSRSSGAPIRGAVRAASVARWQRANPSRPDQTVYFWLSPHELLAFSGTNRRDLQAVRHNTRTGVEMPIPGLTQQLRAARLPRALDVSPDGKWLLWVDLGARPPRPVATTTDGLQTFRWPQGFHNTSLAWLPDSRGWLRTTHLGFNPSIQTYRLGSQQADYAPIKGGGGGWLLGATPQGRLLTIGGTSVSVMDTGEPAHQPSQIVGRPFKSPSDAFRPLQAMPFVIGGGATITEHRLAGPARPQAAATHVKHAKAQFPLKIAAGGDASLALSPDGTRLGWLVYTGRAASLPEQWAARYFPGLFPPASSWSLNLYVSERDGTQMREVGYAAVPRHDRSRGVLRWTPDGTRLSFVYGGALWTVPVR